MKLRFRVVQRETTPSKKAAPPLPPYEIDKRNRKEREKRKFPARQQPMLDIPTNDRPPSKKDDEPNSGVIIIEPGPVDFTINHTVIQL